MQATHPHFLLYAEGSANHGSSPRWKFDLQSVGGEQHFGADDTEYETRTSRLELLAVVRGLEALGQPSRVTLLTRSRYVRRGIRRGLSQWRDKRWHWERFGNVVPIRDHDLWQRVDRALQYHQVQCFAWTDAADTVAHGMAKCREVKRSTYCTSRHHRGWPIAVVLNGIRRAVLTPISSLWRPPFTRAA